MARQPDEKSAAKSKNDDGALIRELALLLDETNLTEIDPSRYDVRRLYARADDGEFPGVVPVGGLARGGRSFNTPIICAGRKARELDARL